MTAADIKRCAFIAALYFIPSQSQATLTDNLTIGSAKAMALGNAVTADPPGIDSIHFNPAGLAQLKGKQKHLKIITADFKMKLKFGDYTPERKALLDRATAAGYFTKEQLFDEAHNSVSTQSGASLMVPGVGMVDLPVMLGPSGGFSYSPPDTPFTVASGIYSPLAIGFNRADNDPGRWMGQRMALTMLTYFSPSIAVNFTENLTVGATITFNYSGVGLDLPIREPHEALLLVNEAQREIGCPNSKVPALPICGAKLTPYEQFGLLHLETENPMSIGFNMGVLWRAQPWLTLGAVYQAPTPMHVKGDFNWESSADWNNFIGPLLVTDIYKSADRLVALMNWRLPDGKAESKGSAKINMNMPMHFAVGSSILLTPDLKLNLDYKYTRWSDWQEMRMKFSEPIDLLRIAEIIQPDLATKTELSIPLGLQDTWNPALGLEYSYNQTLKFRMGVEYRPTSIPANRKSPVIPIGDGYLYGIGIAYETADGKKYDFSLSTFSTKTTINVGDSVLGNNQNPYKLLYNPYVGTNMEGSVDAKLFEFGYSAHF